MKGLTDTEYRALVLASSDPGHDIELSDPDYEASEGVASRGLLHSWTEDHGEDPELEIDYFNVTPLGRLALQLWPAIRVSG